jgi:2-polyprenyl-3-methyl-5-hydroxy-6-metoxy-1,4-benzoquinol methylase
VIATPDTEERGPFDQLGPSHGAVLDTVPDGARVLDVGCGRGYVGELLAAKGCRVVGIELNQENARAAEERCDVVVPGDFESDADRAQLSELGPFDVIIFGDVLEHLTDPGDALRFARTLLSDRGFAMTSLPNIGSWRGRIPIALGRFDYQDSGLFDRTHLRFFTRKTAHELARDSGFEVTGERFTPLPLPFPLVWDRIASKERLRAISQALADARPELFALQFVLTLRPRA